METEIVEKKEKKNRISRVIKSPIFAIFAMIAFSGVAMAYNYPGMDNLSRFIEDMAEIIPKLIPLVISIIIIAVVYKFRDFFNSVLSKMR